MGRILLVTLGVITGCQVHTHVTQYNAPSAWLEAQNPTIASTHIFLIHGLDPLDLGNMQGLQQGLIQIGYTDTKLYQFYQLSSVMEDVQRIKTECPESKIVLIGYSAGAESAAIITNRLHDQSGIDVDCLFYLSGVTLINSEFHHPDYVDRIINIRDAKLPLLGMRLDGAENYWLTDTFHYRSPTHPRTLEILQRELDLLRYAEGR